MKVAVFCGGVSPEREVSLESGAAVAAGLERAGYDAAVEDVSSVRGAVDRWKDLGADIAFIALHGGWGEDGRLQSAFEAREIPFTGSGARSCRLAMDKSLSREVMKNAGVLVPDGFVVRPGDDAPRGTISSWGRAVVKPASGGSTVGVSVIENEKDLADALADVWETDSTAIVERFVPGREATVAVFGEGTSAFALPIVEIRPRSGFYDYGSKYTDGASEYLCPAPFDDAVAHRMAAQAIAAHIALGCRTYSRVDFRVPDDGDACALELNSAPGMTSHSLVPKAAAAFGWTFEELLRRIVDGVRG